MSSMHAKSKYRSSIPKTLLDPYKTIKASPQYANGVSATRQRECLAEEKYAVRQTGQPRPDFISI